MTDFSIRSDNVDVEQIMRQIRSRIREKRGVDYTEEEIRELANVKLEKFLDPRGVRSDLLEQFRRKREASLPPNFKFEDTTLFETHRGFLAFMRRLLKPILKLFFNPNPLIEALHIQSKLNAQQAALEPLYYEVIHNLVLETTRLGIDVKNLKMRVESMSSRLDFDERRARALEGVVQYRPGAVPPLQPPSGSADTREPRGTEAEQAERRNRRRRRRGRRRPDDPRGPVTGMGSDPNARAGGQTPIGPGAGGQGRSYHPGSGAGAREDRPAEAPASGAAVQTERISEDFRDRAEPPASPSSGWTGPSTREQDQSPAEPAKHGGLTPAEPSGDLGPEPSAHRGLTPGPAPAPDRERSGDHSES